MKKHKTFEPNPPNSYKNVLDLVESRFEPNPQNPDKAMPKLLHDFIKLLGMEKEERGGVNAMKACLHEFRKSKYDKVATGKDVEKATCKDFEEFLFSLDRKVIVIKPDPPSSSKTANQDLPKASNTLKEPDRPSSSKTVMPKAQNTLKEPECPSSSKPVSLDLRKAPNTLKGTGNPSTNKAVNPATKKITLKVKIYMETGWDTDFPHLGRCSSPNLLLNLTIHDGKIQKTEVHKSSRKPSWGEECVFQLSSLENKELVVKVSDHKEKNAGTVRRLVSELEAGINVIPLSSEPGKQCNKARLLMRFMFG